MRPPTLTRTAIGDTVTAGDAAAALSAILRGLGHRTAVDAGRPPATSAVSAGTGRRHYGYRRRVAVAWGSRPRHRHRGDAAATALARTAADVAGHRRRGGERSSCRRADVAAANEAVLAGVASVGRHRIGSHQLAHDRVASRVPS